MKINIYMKSKILISKEVNDDQLDEILDAIRKENNRRIISIDDEFNAVYIVISEIEFVEVNYFKDLA